MIFILIFYIFISRSYCIPEVKYLNPNEAITFKPTEFRSAQRFRIYCYEGKPKSVLHIWQSVFLNIDLNSEDYTQYDGPSPESVVKEYEAHRTSWNMNLFTWKNKIMKLDPFNQSCVGIESNEDYVVRLKVIHIDYWKVLMLISGVFIYFTADKLSQNVIFYYICGISFGITASFLILIYFISKLFPRKPVMYGIFATGWTVTFYLLQLVKENLRTILGTYKTYIIYYTLTSGVISFIICYRCGPIKDQKTQNLIKWSLQLLGLSTMFFSSHFQEAVIAQILIVFIFYNIPVRWLSMPKNYIKKKFPPKIKLLTNDEYYEQGVRETNKSLQELRKYCLSPECNQWKTALKLKDVKRFASFIEGNSHLSDEEVLEYETSINQSGLTDDESEEYTDEDN